MLTTTIESVQELERLRGDIAALLGRRGVSGTPAADTGLVVTELAVNGFEHGGAEKLEVKVAVEDQDIRVELTHLGVVDLPIPATSSMPDPLSMRHRGLAIVDLLARGREIIPGPGGTIVRCSITR
ncbi:MAG: hypothetical protein R2710_23140 [Acidimicrobiales bacterium]